MDKINKLTYNISVLIQRHHRPRPTNNMEIWQPRPTNNNLEISANLNLDAIIPAIKIKVFALILLSILQQNLDLTFGNLQTILAVLFRQS